MALQSTTLIGAHSVTASWLCLRPSLFQLPQRPQLHLSFQTPITSVTASAYLHRCVSDWWSSQGSLCSTGPHNWMKLLSYQDIHFEQGMLTPLLRIQTAYAKPHQQYCKSEKPGEGYAYYCADTILLIIAPRRCTLSKFIFIWYKAIRVGSPVRVELTTEVKINETRLLLVAL